jgi:hypothetical protein
MKKISQWMFFGMFAVLVPLAGNALAQWRGYNWGHGPGMMGWGMVGVGLEVF